METTRPLILITNDDSINAPGIHHLADILRSFGDVYVVAPSQPHSGQSAALTVGAPLRINEVKSETDGIRLFTVNGTPVDCIKLALHAIVPRRPDFIFSGINHGSNSAVNVTYSGTMGAVMEGCLEGIPSVGFSILHHSMKADFSLSTAFIANIAAEVIEHGLPKGVCLNVNIPARFIPEGIKVCRAAKGYWTSMCWSARSMSLMKMGCRRHSMLSVKVSPASNLMFFDWFTRNLRFDRYSISHDLPLPH